MILQLHLARLIIGASIFTLGVSFMLPRTAGANTQCTFTRDLELEMVGEDVRCLQKYLNGAGFTIAASGVGSPGRETNQFKLLTQQAVIKWQEKNGISPASGYFGQRSRAKYAELAKGSTASNSNPAATSNAELNALTQELARLQGKPSPSPTPPAGTAGEKQAREKITDAIDMLEQASDEADGAGEEREKALRDLQDANEDFLNAIKSYFAGNYTQSMDFADDAYDNALDAFETAGGKTREMEIDELIDDVDEAIDQAYNKIREAKHADEDTDEAEELLDDAKAKIKAAKAALRDDELDEAEDLAEEAEDLADEAVDAIGDNSEKDEAQDAIKDADSRIDDVREEIEEAKDDDEDTDEAEDLLDEAEDKLKDARDAYDDKDYDEAKDLAEEAEDLAKDAQNEL